MLATQQADMFGGAPPDALVVRRRCRGRSCCSWRNGCRKSHLGTSSLSFPAGPVLCTPSSIECPQLVRHGLRAYAQHPMLNALNIDSTFYRPQAARQLAQSAAEVPEGSGLSSKPIQDSQLRPIHRGPCRKHRARFLDPVFAQETVIAPLCEGLGSKLGAVLFQFSPLGHRYTRDPGAFVTRLGEFLTALPRGPVYAVELRDPEFLGPRYEAGLRRLGRCIARRCTRACRLSIVRLWTRGPHR